MGLLDWFSRLAMRLRPSTVTRHAGPGDWLRSLPPRPDAVEEMGADAPMVVVRRGQTTNILDRDAFGYAYAATRGPDPAQRDLDDAIEYYRAALPRARRERMRTELEPVPYPD